MAQLLHGYGALYPMPVATHRASLFCLVFALAVAGTTTRATADARQRARVIVLPSAGARTAELAARIDAALVRALSTDARFGDVEVSTVPLSDLGLAAGCDDMTRDCLTRIARTVGADVVVLRELRQTQGETRITLTSFDALGAGAPLRAEVHLEDPDQVGPEVRELVRRLFVFGGSELATGTSGAMDDAATGHGDGGVSTLTWIMLGAGAAALGTGVVLGLLANDAHDDYAETRIKSDRDAERAASLLDAAENRALAANILFGGAGALLGAGATLLVLDLSGADGGKDEVRLGTAPSANGAFVWMRATTEGL